MTTTAVPAVVQTAITYLMGKLARTKDVAVGIVSVMYAAESKLKTGSQGAQSTETPGALNPSGAYGIASWNGPRQGALASFAHTYGLDVADLLTQLHFVVTESANSYPQVWAVMQNPSTTYDEMIVAFTNYYENPANKQNEINEAVTFAKSIYDAVVVPTAATPLPAPAPIVASTAPPAPSIPAPVAAIVTALGSAIPGLGGIVGVAEALAPVAGLAGGPVGTAITLAINPATINALVAAEPLIESIITALIKAAMAAAAAQAAKAA